MTKSLAHTLWMKSLFLWKNFNLHQKKYSTPPDIIAPSQKKIVNFTEKNFSPWKKSLFSPSWKNLNLQDTLETSQLLWKNLNPCFKYFLSTKKINLLPRI